MPKHPTGWSKWTHREKGGDYTALTVAKGTGADHGTAFVYYLGLDKGSGSLQAFVRRLEDWHAKMQPADQDEGPWYLHHPESDATWVVDTPESRDEALADGLVHEISADRYEELTGLYSTDPFEDYEPGVDDFDLDL